MEALLKPALLGIPQALWQPFRERKRGQATNEDKLDDEQLRKNKVFHSMPQPSPKNGTPLQKHCWNYCLFRKRNFQLCKLPTWRTPRNDAQNTLES